MAARVTGYAESLAESTYATDTNYQNKVTVNHTPSANSNIFVFYSALLSNNTAGSQSKARLRNSVSGTTLCEVMRSSKDATDYTCVSGFAIESFGASPAQQTYDIDFGRAAGTAGIKEARISILELDADEFFEINDGPHTVTDTNNVTGVTMTETFANGVDYYIFPMAELTTTSTAPRVQIEAFYNGATVYGAMDHDLNDSADVIPWCPSPFKITGDGTSKTIIIRCRSTSTTDVGFRKVRLLALRADKFEATFYDESRARATTTSTTYQDKVTSTHTPAAVEHLIFGGGILDCGSATSSALAQLIEGASSLGEHTHEANTSGASGGAMCYHMGYRKTLAASSTTWKTQYKSETGTITTGMAESSVLILQTGTSTGGATMPAAAGSYTLTGQAAGLRASRQIGAAAGSYALSGQAATLHRQFTLTANPGSYELSGQNAGLHADRRLAAGAGAYSLTGQSAGLHASRSLLAGTGAYALSGNAADLILEAAEAAVNDWLTRARRRGRR